MDERTALLAAEMGVTKDRVLKIRTARTLAEAQRLLEEMQADAKAAYRKLVFRYHPDRNPSDPEAGDKVRVLGVLLAEVQALRVQAPPQPVAVWVSMGGPITHGRPGYGATVTSTNVGTGTSTTYDAWRVAYMRVV